MCIVSAVDLSQCNNFTYAVFCCRIQSDDGAIVLKKKFVIKQRTQYVRSSFCPLMSFRQGACVGEKIISCICLVYSTTCKVTAPCLTCPWQAVHTIAQAQVTSGMAHSVWKANTSNNIGVVLQCRAVRTRRCISSTSSVTRSRASTSCRVTQGRCSTSASTTTRACSPRATRTALSSCGSERKSRDS